jgi:hypothetical protein
LRLVPFIWRFGFGLRLGPFELKLVPFRFRFIFGLRLGPFGLRLLAPSRLRLGFGLRLGTFGLRPLGFIILLSRVLLAFPSAISLAMAYITGTVFLPWFWFWTWIWIYPLAFAFGVWPYHYNMLPMLWHWTLLCLRPSHLAIMQSHESSVYEIKSDNNFMMNPLDTCVCKLPRGWSQYEKLNQKMSGLKKFKLHLLSFTIRYQAFCVPSAKSQKGGV